MKASQSGSFATRVASLLASLAITVMVVGSQLGIADSYTRQANAVLAAKQTPQPVAQGAATARPRAS